MRTKLLAPRGLAGAIALGAVLAAAPVSAQPEGQGLAALAAGERVARQIADLSSVGIYRAGLARTVDHARAHPELFPAARPKEARLLAADQRDSVRAVWRAMIDYTFVLDSLERFHAEFYKLSDPRERAQSFHVASGAFAAAYRHALDFIALAENDPKLGIILNDAVGDLGLPAGTYDRYKFRYLNAAAATRFAAYALAGRAFGPPSGVGQARAAEEDTARILEAGRGPGQLLTAANAVNVLRQLGAGAIFPVQAGISEWMGDTKVLRQERSLISPAQVGALRDRMLPGDIMLQRREWYLSNVGLPGFWSHAALYVGTPEERRAFFGAEDVRGWVLSRGEPSGDLERLLEREYPAARAAASAPVDSGHVPRVIEAISDGVVFTTLEHSASADSVVVLRPRLGRVEIAAALLRAWGYAGRPYDFDFDFQTDSALVCTELIYKAFEPSARSAGLRLRLEEIMGRTAIPANAIARQFDEEFGAPSAQFDFVAFLDGQEKGGVATEAGIDAFRASWRRPKWHILIQEARAADEGLR